MPEGATKTEGRINRKGNSKKGFGKVNLEIVILLIRRRLEKGRWAPVSFQELCKLEALRGCSEETIKLNIKKLEATENFVFTGGLLFITEKGRIFLQFFIK